MHSKLLHKAYRETKDYDNPLHLPAQVADRLHQWSFNGYHVLNAQDIDILIKKAPFAGGKLYRGMNFRTQKSYENFWLASQEGTVYPGESWSSWTPFENEAFSFAVTWPTYNLNYELMHAEDTKSKNKDFMIGYQGIIVSIEVGAGEAADIRETGFAHESEIIIPAGTYPMQIIKNFKPFKRDITEQSTADEQFMSIKSLSSGYENFDSQKFRYIVSNFPNFSLAAKQHLQDLIVIPKEVMVKIEIKEPGWRDTTTLYIGDNITYDMVAYYPLLPPAGKVKVQKFVDRVMREKIRKVTAFLKENSFDWSKVDIEGSSKKMLEGVVNPELATKYKNLFRSRMSERYHLMDDMVKEINSADPSKQRDMLEKYMEQMARLISNMGKVAKLEDTPKIEDFISGSIRNVWLHSKFMDVYVRKASHVIEEKLTKCFDIASVTVKEKKQNKGIFTNWLVYVENTIPKYGINVVYCESILNPYLSSVLERRGYKYSSEDCMYKIIGNSSITAKLLKKAKSNEDIIKEIKQDHKVDPFFSPFVQEHRNRGVKVVIGFLQGKIQPLASWSDGLYTCYILNDFDNSKIIMKSGDPYPVPSGKWMDWPEEHCYMLPDKKRAEMECKEQVEKWIPKEFEDQKNSFYHPEEHEEKFLAPYRESHFEK